MKLPDSFFPPISINHCFCLVLYIVTSVHYVSHYWSVNSGVSVCSSPQEKVAYEFILSLQQCHACLVHPIWMVCVMGSNSCCFVRCCFQDLFKTANIILVWFSSNLFSMYFIRVLSGTFIE